MKAHAFWVVTGRIDPSTWIVATCLTPQDAIVVRDALVANMNELAASEPYNKIMDEAESLGGSPIIPWLKQHAHDPFLVRYAEKFAARIIFDLPVYDVFRSYDDFTEIADLVTGVETSA